MLARHLRLRRGQDGAKGTIRIDSLRQKNPSADMFQTYVLRKAKTFKNVCILINLKKNKHTHTHKQRRRIQKQKKHYDALFVRISWHGQFPVRIKMKRALYNCAAQPMEIAIFVSFTKIVSTTQKTHQGPSSIQCYPG